MRCDAVGRVLLRQLSTSSEMVDIIVSNFLYFAKFPMLDAFSYLLLFPLHICNSFLHHEIVHSFARIDLHKFKTCDYILLNEPISMLTPSWLVVDICFNINGCRHVLLPLFATRLVATHKKYSILADRIPNQNWIQMKNYKLQLFGLLSLSTGKESLVLIKSSFVQS